MGTNYYAITKVDEVTKMNIKAAIDADDYGAAKSFMPKTIHIGKSAGGWYFLFNHNNWEFFEKTEESVQSFLNRCQIMDEYGRTVNHNDFWVMVETKKKLKPELQYGFVENGLNFSNYTEFS